MKINNVDQEELELQKSIAYTAGVLQGDVTIKNLLESIAEGVVIINNQGRIILINPRMSQLTGYTKTEVMGQYLDIFIPDPFHKMHKKYVQGFIREPKIRPMGIGLELTAKRKDQSSFPVEISISFITVETGTLGIGFITDISSRKKAERDLISIIEELDAYAHTVAHDLNASLSGVIGFSEMILDEDNEVSRDEIKDYVKEIAAGGRKMAEVIKNLLLFAKMKQNEFPVYLVNMNDIIQSTLNRLMLQIKEKHAEVTIKGEILDCYSYNEWIEEILFNFLSNALKYGGNPPSVEISCDKVENVGIKYNVKDNGKGISKKFREIIFNDNNPSRMKFVQGTGLGLTIVKRIISKMDGQLLLETEEGKGSTFSFIVKNT